MFARAYAKAALMHRKTGVCRLRCFNVSFVSAQSIALRCGDPDDPGA